MQESVMGERCKALPTLDEPEGTLRAALGLFQSISLLTEFSLFFFAGRGGRGECDVTMQESVMGERCKALPTLDEPEGTRCALP
ncbi:uncharacterized protein MONOS_18515 [Monocercomonoides exilis]|uniref:uncharacterized protein n=1 Tax=Monocercomonoides exilis TaxID=2049356 RepID=UPI003559859D|nr:hypothetical protein MONOS_18514 [Monocercomonoides exilis]KAH7814647.1 hypothetical protein MONOS_18515 [Monocercomonoides exilis]